MQPIERDYQPPENDELGNIEDGVYSPESVSFMKKCIDDVTKKPKLIDSKYGLVVMFNVMIVGNDEDTIPLSCRLAEIPFMVQAFTGKAAELLPAVPALDQVQAIETYLMLSSQIVNEGILKPTIRVKNGWGSVYRLSGSQIPVDNYHGYFTDIASKNNVDLPAPAASAKYPDEYQYDGLFLLVADQYGEQCGWSGVSHLQKFLKYKATTILQEGKLVTDWVRGPKTGKYTKTALDFSNFVRDTAPSLFADGVPNFNDPANICPEWILAAQSDRVLLNFKISKNKKGYAVLDTTSVSVADSAKLRFDVDDSVISSISVPNAVVDTGQVTSVNHLQILCDLLNVFIPENVLPKFQIPFPQANVLNETMLTVLKKYLGPIGDHLSTRKLNNFTLADVRLVIDNLPFESLEQLEVEKIAVINERLLQVIPLTEDEIPF